MFDELKQLEPHWTVLACQVLAPGKTLYGYCGGLFGRESLGEKYIVSSSIEGGGFMQEREIILLVVVEDGGPQRVVLSTADEVECLITSSNRCAETAIGVSRGSTHDKKGEDDE